MGNRRKQELLESARNTATGYAVVVLSIACFILVLMVTVMIVRLGAGISGTANGANQATKASAVASTVTSPQS